MHESSVQYKSMTSSFTAMDTYSINSLPFIQKVKSNDKKSIQEQVSAIKAIILNPSEQPIIKINSVRLVKDMVNQNNATAINEIDIELVEALFYVAQYKYEIKDDARGSTYFGSQKDQKIQGNSYLRLILECLFKWGISIKQNPLTKKESNFSICLQQLIRMGVKFPSKFSYVKLTQTEQARQQELMAQQSLEKKQIDESRDIVPPTVTPQGNLGESKLDSIIETLQQLNGYIDFLELMFQQSAENDMDYLQDINERFKKFQGNSELMMNQLFQEPQDVQEKYFNEVINYQDFLEKYFDITANYKNKKINFQEYKRQILDSIQKVHGTETGTVNTQNDQPSNYNYLILFLKQLDQYSNAASMDQQTIYLMITYNQQKRITQESQFQGKTVLWNNLYCLNLSQSEKENILIRGIDKESDEEFCAGVAEINSKQDEQEIIVDMVKNSIIIAKLSIQIKLSEYPEQETNDILQYKSPGIEEEEKQLIQNLSCYLQQQSQDYLLQKNQPYEPQ